VKCRMIRTGRHAKPLNVATESYGPSRLWKRKARFPKEMKVLGGKIPPAPQGEELHFRGKRYVFRYLTTPAIGKEAPVRKNTVPLTRPYQGKKKRAS